MVAATPVDAELARVNRPSLIGTITPVVDGADYEEPVVLSAELDAYVNGTAQRDRRVRWIDGYSFLPDDCKGGHLVDPCQIGASADSSTESGTSTVVGPIQPFIIEATDVCSTFGAGQGYRLWRAQRKLLAIQSAALEAEWWSGTKAQSQGWTNNQYLRKSATVIEGGSALGYLTALAALEQAIADGSSWQRGVIHATPRVVSHWIESCLVRAVPNPPNTLMTELGTLVIPGTGYPGTGPQGGHQAHIQWAYATGIPQIRLGAITYNETDADVVAIDRDANTRTIRAARFASIAVTPCINSAVLVDLSREIFVPGS